MDLSAIEEEKKAKRLEEWKIWIREFLGTNSDLTLIPNAAELLNIYYWRLVQHFLKPLLKDLGDEEDHNLHYYKIISASELTIMSVMPFKIKGVGSDEHTKQANADFAWFVATSIMVNWKIDGVALIDTGKLDDVVFYTELIDNNGDGEKFYPLNFMDEHIEWLKDLNTAGPLPVLSNSQTWRMVFLASKISN